MQHDKEYGPFQVEAEFALQKERLDDLGQTQLPPEPLEDERRTNGNAWGVELTVAGEDQQRLLREAGQRSD